MYKMMIADDEPKIRNGLRKMLDYGKFGIEVIGEAEDGEVALRKVTEKQPDILFLDICMPFLNGLDLISKLKDHSNCLIVIITGYDQTTYMQEAIKLQVFDYLFKPVSKSNLIDCVKRVCGELDERRNRDRYFKWVNERVNENINAICDNFFQNLIKNGMNSEQIASSLSFFNLRFPRQVGIMVLKVKHSQFDKAQDSIDGNMMLFGIKNIISELLGPQQSFCLCDETGNIVIIGDTSGIENWPTLCDIITSYIGEYVGSSVICEYDVVNSLADVTAAYQKLTRQLKIKSGYKPIITSILQYMQSNYYDSRFSLEKTAEKFKITPPYLSKLLKTETGCSFVDVLTNIRIQKAITLMDTSSLKIYEIAELVGYNNQYYFSRSFKKVTGISPVQYKEGKSL